MSDLDDLKNDLNESASNIESLLSDLNDSIEALKETIMAHALISKNWHETDDGWFALDESPINRPLSRELDEGFFALKTGQYLSEHTEEPLVKIERLLKEQVLLSTGWHCSEEDDLWFPPHKNFTHSEFNKENIREGVYVDWAYEIVKATPVEQRKIKKLF